MKVKELLQELKEKDSYKNFIEENPESYFCSAMFVFGDGDKIDLNFFLPNKNQISSFAIPFASVVNHPEEIQKQEELKDLDFKIDACDLKKSIEDKTGKKFTKLIAVLHGGNWNITCLNGLDMSRMNINAYTGDFEEKGEGSIMDMVRFKKGDR